MSVRGCCKVIICKYDSTFILVQVVVPISAARTCISIATSADSQDILRIFIFRPDGPLVIQPDCLHTHYDFDQGAQLPAYPSLWRRGRAAAPCACVVPRRGGYSLNISYKTYPTHESVMQHKETCHVTLVDHTHTKKGVLTFNFQHDLVQYSVRKKISKTLQTLLRQDQPPPPYMCASHDAM